MADNKRQINMIKTWYIYWTKTLSDTEAFKNKDPKTSGKLYTIFLCYEKSERSWKNRNKPKEVFSDSSKLGREESVRIICSDSFLCHL